MSVDDEKRIIENSFLKNYYEDKNVTDVAFDGQKLWIEDNISLPHLSPVQPTYAEVEKLIKIIANHKHMEFTDTDAILDTEIAELRLNSLHKVASPYGMTFSFRVSRAQKVAQNISDLCNPKVGKLMELLTKAKINQVISGATGAGKTEAQKLLVEYIPDYEKICLMEDSKDTHLKEVYPNKYIFSWLTVMNDNRDKPITFHDLFKASLRNNPVWIILSETRDEVAFDMLEAAGSNHKIITTLHADEAEEIVFRLIYMISRAFTVNEILLGKKIVRSLPIGCFMEKKLDEPGFPRKITQLEEFTGFNENGLESIPIYRREKVYNRSLNKYEYRERYSPLSQKTIQKLINAELFHELPKVFIPEESLVGVI